MIDIFYKLFCDVTFDNGSRCLLDQRISIYLTKSSTFSMNEINANANVNELIQMNLIQSYIGDIKFLLLSMCVCLPTNWEKKNQQNNAQHKMWIKHGSLAHAFRFLSVWRIVQPKKCYFADIFSFDQVDKSKPLKVKLFNSTNSLCLCRRNASNQRI